MLEELAARRRAAGGRDRQDPSRFGSRVRVDRVGTALRFVSRCADESQSKPHPAMLLELADELNVQPRRMLMIGDTTHDLQMAAAAGVAQRRRDLRRAFALRT